MTADVDDYYERIEERLAGTVKQIENTL